MQLWHTRLLPQTFRNNLSLLVLLLLTTVLLQFLSVIDSVNVLLVRSCRNGFLTNLHSNRLMVNVQARLLIGTILILLLQLLLLLLLVL